MYQLNLQFTGYPSVDRKKKEERDRLLLEKYRGDFCYSDEVGQQAVWDSDRLKALVDQWKERDEHKEDYDRALALLMKSS